MATYLKRTSNKLFDVTLSGMSAESLSDLMCPICRGILIEPVTLPCAHNLCLRCLKGTFEHNSLSCPLCRVRVSSWLRQAKKTDNLVNNELWQLIRTRFPQEVEGKFAGIERVIQLDSELTAAKKILSAAGELRREFEEHLVIARQEKRLQLEKERIANEELIKKLQVEDKEQRMAQLGQDRLFARSLVKRQMTNKDRAVAKHCRQYNSNEIGSVEKSKTTAMCSTNVYGTFKVANVVDGLNASKVPLEKCTSLARAASLKEKPCQKLPTSHKQDAFVMSSKPQAQLYHHTNNINYISEPGCSSSQIYGTQSKEELRVPSDILSSKKKSLGVEICTTVGVADQRIGSAESAGSHDSINQEIHHFKPIISIARTPLKVMSDGKSSDPKLLRVVPVYKKVSNAVLKPPSPTRFKQILGCSWSAFRGKMKLIAGKTIDLHSKADTIDHPLVTVTKVSKSMNETERRMARRFELPNVTFDSNKNYYTKIFNKINGTKVSKKLILEENQVMASNNAKSHKGIIRNGALPKTKRRKSVTDDAAAKTSRSAVDVPEVEELSGNSAMRRETQLDNEEKAIENIAERIKRRKVNMELNNVKVPVETERKAPLPKRTRKAPTKAKEVIVSEDDEPLDKRLCRRIQESTVSRAKTKEKSSDQSSCEEVESKQEESNIKVAKRVTQKQGKSCKKRKKEITRNSKRKKIAVGERHSSNSNENTAASSDNSNKALRVEVIKEQNRVEKVSRQEQDDFELARRLQAEFDVMERVAARTRGCSKRAVAVESTINDRLFESKRTANAPLSKVTSLSDFNCTAGQSSVEGKTFREGRKRSRRIPLT